MPEKLYKTKGEQEWYKAQNETTIKTVNQDSQSRQDVI